MIKDVGKVVFLTAIWVLLWGSVTVSNIVSGVLVALLLQAVFPIRTPGDRSHAPTRRPRPLAWLRLLAFVARQLIVSNAVIAREIVTPGSRVRTGIVGCRLTSDRNHLVTFVANVLALSPGTMPVHVQMSPPTIYVHVLHLHDPDATRRMVTKLEALSLRAFGHGAP